MVHIGKDLDLFRKIAAGVHQFKDDIVLLNVLKGFNNKDNDGGVCDKDTVYVFCHRNTGHFYLKLYVLIALELYKRGYPVYFLFKDIYSNRYSPSVNVSFKGLEVASRLPVLMVDGIHVSDSLIEKNLRTVIVGDERIVRSHNFFIDLGKGRALVEGINFFPIILNTFRANYKCYNVDLSDGWVYSVFGRMLDSCCVLLDYFFMLKKYAADNGLKVRFVGWEDDFIPNGVFNFLCHRFSEDRDVEYVSVARGYGAYFGDHYHNSRVVVTNLTYPFRDNNLMLVDSELKVLRERYSVDDVVLDDVRNILHVDDVSVLNDEQLRVVDKIKHYKNRGGRVFVLFSHLFYDTVMDDSSCCFDDMCSWIRESISFFRDGKDLLVLKPHPVEISNSVLSPNETLGSFLKSNDIVLSDNMLLLPARLFSLNDLVGFIDYGLIWRSSAALELAVHGVPCVIAGCPPFKSLGFCYAKDRDDYFRIVSNPDGLLSFDKGLGVDAARYILGMRDKHSFVKCLSYNPSVKRNCFNGGIVLDGRLVDECVG